VILLLMLAGSFSLFPPSFESVPPASETILTHRIPIEQVTETKEQIQPAPQPEILPTSVGKPGIVHNTQQGDSLWGIARLFYADPYLWPNIFRINVDLIENPDTLEVGITIHLPRLEGAAGSLIQKDIMNITDGYMQAYLAYRLLGKNSARYYLWVVKQCKVPEVLEKYEDRIDKSDWRFILRIKGSARIR